jgi:hypothetical protein
MFSDNELKEMAARWLGADRTPRRIRVFTDTSDFFGIEYDDIVILGNRHISSGRTREKAGLV